jgi:pimeloyl-ACP methyl ester carboxylesterase
MTANHEIAELNERFESFYSRAAYKDIRIDGSEWTYMDIGNPKGKPLVFLPGGLKHPLWSFGVLDLFLDEYRVISPCYPPIGDIDAVLDGVKCILDHESIDHCFMIGSSWGGSMVQCFSYKYPDVADKIVLSNTGSMYSKAMIPALKLYKFIIRVKKKEKVMAQWREQVLTLLGQPPAYRAFWEGLLDRFYEELFSYEDYVTMIQNQIEYMERYAFPMIKNPRYKKPVLIISSQDETAQTKAVRDKVRELYENHTYYEFDMGGHAVAIANPEKYKEIVLRFLEE